MDMVKIEFLGPINRENMEIKADNLSDVKVILNKDSELKEWLSDCAVAVNDEIINDLNIALKSGDRVSLLPPVCGG